MMIALSPIRSSSDGAAGKASDLRDNLRPASRLGLISRMRSESSTRRETSSFKCVSGANQRRI